MAVSDYQAGKVVAGYDAASANALASNADGTYTVIHERDPAAH
jgi:hypothetical protein